MKKGFGSAAFKCTGAVIIIGILGMVLFSKFIGHKPDYVWKQAWAQELLKMDDSYTGGKVAVDINSTLLQCENARLQDWEGVAACAEGVSEGQACGSAGSKCMVTNGGCASVNLHYCEFGMARKGANANKPCNHRASDSYSYYLKEELCAEHKELIEKAPWSKQRFDAKEGCMSLVTGFVCSEK